MANTDPDNWFLPARLLPRQPRYTSGNATLALVDGEEYYTHLATRLRAMSSGEELYLAGWRVTPWVLLEPLTSPTSKFLDQVTTLIRRGIAARTMVWYFPFTYIARVNHPKDNLDFTKGVIAARGSGSTGILDERVINKLASHHQKFVIVESDGTYWAYVGGLDLCVDRWDTPSHSSPPQRQKEFLDGWHDVQCAVRGHAVSQIWENFKQRWNDRTPPTRPPSPLPVVAPPPITSHAPPAATFGTQNVQVLRTLVCRGIYPFAPRGEQTPRLAYERVISQAEHYVYIEEQYLWPCSVVDSLRNAIARNSRLKVVILLARDYDLPAPLSTAHYEMREEAIQTIRGRSRNQLYVYHLEQLSTRKPIYVHSKLLIVDDCYAAVGSVNVNRRSLTTDSELQLGVVDDAKVAGIMDGRAVTVCKFAKDLRVKLWQEHLNISDPRQLEDPIAAIALWPDWSRSTPRHPSRVHHAVCHHPRSEQAATISEWISVLRAIDSLISPPFPWDQVLATTLRSLEGLSQSRVITFSHLYLLLGGLLWSQLKRVLKDYVLNVETTC